MKLQYLVIILCSLLFFSCQKNINPEQESIGSSHHDDAKQSHPIHPKWATYISAIKAGSTKSFQSDGYYRRFFDDPQGVAPSDCTPSYLNSIVENYFNQFEFWDYTLFPDYIWINRSSAMIDRSKQFFGRKGEYTPLEARHQRKLETFWNIKTPVRVNGQHSETLGNRDKIAEVFMTFTGHLPEDAYYVADQIIAMNKDSKVFPQSPLLSFDGFATSDRLIVLGDGLIEALTKTGVEGDIVLAGLLAHEWGHQVQFDNSSRWYKVKPAEWQLTPAFTRQTELEADFFSSYFLTHKRGGAFNWKKVAQFNELFYTIGDCEFTDPGHHGTPTQRQNAAKLGYSTANQARAQGHILTADQLHIIFMANLHSLLAI